MMQFLRKALLTLVVGIILGLALTWFTVMRGTFGTVTDGPWRTSATLDHHNANPFERATTAWHRLFARNTDATVTYTAGHDSGGQALDGNCIYRITGHEPDAQWWTMTAYGPDGYLIKNKRGLYSVSKASVARRRNGTIVITAAHQRAPGNWIAVGTSHFSLTMRLYEPAPGVVADPANALMPVITRVVCP